MKKTLIILITGLLVVGCGKSLEEKAVGTYDRKRDDETLRYVLLDNSIVEDYVDSEKRREEKWSIVGNELHMESTSGYVYVYRLNPDSSISRIGIINPEGKRKDYDKDHILELTWKKIK